MAFDVSPDGVLFEGRADHRRDARADHRRRRAESQLCHSSALCHERTEHGRQDLYLEGIRHPARRAAARREFRGAVRIRAGRRSEGHLRHRLERVDRRQIRGVVRRKERLPRRVQREGEPRPRAFEGCLEGSLLLSAGKFRAAVQGREGDTRTDRHEDGDGRRRSRSVGGRRPLLRGLYRKYRRPRRLGIRRRQIHREVGEERSDRRADRARHRYDLHPRRVRGGDHAIHRSALDERLSRHYG